VSDRRVSIATGAGSDPFDGAEPFDGADPNDPCDPNGDGVDPCTAAGVDPKDPCDGVDVCAGVDPCDGVDIVDGADTIGAPSPSDGNGVRPVSMAGGDSVDPVGGVGMVDGIGAAGECAGDAGARPSEFPLRLPNKRTIPQQFQAACFKFWSPGLRPPASSSGHQA